VVFGSAGAWGQCAPAALGGRFWAAPQLHRDCQQALKNGLAAVARADGSYGPTLGYDETDNGRLLRRKMSLCQSRNSVRCLTIVGGVRDALAAWRLGR
jgi:hypothetical protein